MNRREKTLLIIFASGVGLLVAVMAGKRLLWGPAREHAAKAESLSQENHKIGMENRRLARARGHVAALRDRTLDDNALRASVLVASRINQLAKQAGLDAGNFTVSPFTRGGSANSFSEVGCALRGHSSLDRITNLLYLLRQDKYLHRVSNLEILPQTGRDKLSFSLRYTTPVFDRPLPVKIPPRKAPTTQLVETASLNELARASYDAIEKRRPFHPYVPPKPPPPPPPPRTARPSMRPPPPPQPPPPPERSFERLVLTGLPSCGDRPEVHLTTLGRDVEKFFKVGEDLPVGQIAMVDYRVLPMPGKPEILSPSRVILRIGKDYWAVELGQRLGERRLLRPNELPQKLKSRPAGEKAGVTTRPAGRG